MTSDTLNVCMYTPTAARGHALYAQELLTALADVGRERGICTELVTCEDLAPENLATCYPIHRILPRIVPRREFRNTVSWAVSRMGYYARRERTFLDWVATRRDLGVVHFQEYTPWLAPRHVERLRRRLRVVFTVHNVAVHNYKIIGYNTVRNVSLRMAWRKCDALLVHSEGLRESLSGFLGPGHPPIYITPHGVWRGAGNAACAPPEERAGRTKLLFFGAIRSNKGVHVLLRALEHLPQHDLIIAGAPENSAYHAQVVDLVRRFPAGRVELVDRYVTEEEMRGFFERSHLVILPYTFFEAQSGVLYQALAHGRPVVASAVGALGESVRQWGIGSVVSANDDIALARGIEHAIEPENYRASMASIARLRDELTWTKTAEATIEAYRSVLA